MSYAILNIRILGDFDDDGMNLDMSKIFKILLNFVLPISKYNAILKHVIKNAVLLLFEMMKIEIFLPKYL